ncbi:PD-(D/E)XK nuclease family protein [Heliomicrobium undosum]|uniref:PD-(D/E)XK nuclease family protein n=1 Tax=Heliomicrobium undosum TaxID=121734 RepID=UPI001479689A|nr:PD-(D/E)XK nuclease family protein [Heliomicrobium undosum]
MPDSFTLDWTLLAVVIAVAVIAGALLFSYLYRAYLRWLAWWRQRAGRIGEQQAAKLLKREGYAVIKAQPPARMVMRVDGAPVNIHVRADYLVQRGGKTYVAEVKTGERAPRPTNGDTRRQLLEYSLIYRADGVLLVDMAAQKIHRVEFEFSQ